MVRSARSIHIVYFDWARYLRFSLAGGTLGTSDTAECIISLVGTLLR